jgi:hypothetical protein
MLMSDSTRSGMSFRMAAKTSAAVVGDADLEASLDELFGNQRRGLAVVFNAEDLFARFRHALAPRSRENGPDISQYSYLRAKIS